jgi:hypothetical protein
MTILTTRFCRYYYRLQISFADFPSIRQNELFSKRGRQKKVAGERYDASNYFWPS